MLEFPLAGAAADDAARCRSRAAAPASSAPSGAAPPVRGPVRLAPMICFDAIFPEINVAFARQDPEPEILVNPTNDAWYGYSSGPYQFLAIVRMRAIEAGKAVVRARLRGRLGGDPPDRRGRARARSRSAPSTRSARPIPTSRRGSSSPRCRACAGGPPTLESATSSPGLRAVHRRGARRRVARARRGAPDGARA